MNTAGLSLDQAPPLWVPAGFFLLAPVALLLAGLQLAVDGPDVLLIGWLPPAVGLVHLGTLGFLGAVMFGALYQMIPVVASTPVPGVGLARVVLGLYAMGVAAMVFALLAGAPVAAQLARVSLGLAVVLFLLPVGWALLRAPAASDTVQGMRLAVLSLALVVTAGLLLLPTGDLVLQARPAWRQAHLSVALLGWVGGLLTAVSWTLAPMFWMAPPPSRWESRGTLAAIALGVLAVVVVHIGGLLGAPWHDAWAAGQALPLAALPAVLAVWLVHPLRTLQALARRRRPRADSSLRWWRLGLAVAPLVALAGAAAVLLPQPHWDLLFGWLAIWGWAGSIMLGTLTRISTFLVWFHRFSPLVGRVRVPSMRALLPDARVGQGWWLHLGVVLLGVVAIVTGQGLVIRLLGAALLVEGLAIGWALVHVLLQRPDPDAQLLARPQPPAMRKRS